MVSVNLIVTQVPQEAYDGITLNEAARVLLNQSAGIVICPIQGRTWIFFSDDAADYFGKTTEDIASALARILKLGYLNVRCFPSEETVLPEPLNEISELSSSAMWLVNHIRVKIMIKVNHDKTEEALQEYIYQLMRD